jgi:hypothetical protein
MHLPSFPSRGLLGEWGEQKAGRLVVGKAEQMALCAPLRGVSFSSCARYGIPLSFLGELAAISGIACSSSRGGAQVSVFFDHFEPAAHMACFLQYIHEYRDDCICKCMKNWRERGDVWRGVRRLRHRFFLIVEKRGAKKMTQLCTRRDNAEIKFRSNI